MAARMERRTLAVRWGGEDGEANLGGEEWRCGVAASGGGEGAARKGRKGHCRQNQYMVSSMAPDGNECACTCTRVCIECWCARARARARGHVHESASKRVRAGNLCACARAHPQMRALTGLTGGRCLLPAGWTVGRMGGQLTLSRAGDNNLSVPL